MNKSILMAAIVAALVASCGGADPFETGADGTAPEASNTQPTQSTQNDDSPQTADGGPGNSESQTGEGIASTDPSSPSDGSDTESDTIAPASIPCAENLWCAGAAVVSIAPSDKHIEGVTEARDGGQVVQKMNIGGYGGVNPEAIADPQNLLLNFNIGLGPAEGNYSEQEENGDAHSLSLRTLYVAEPGKAELIIMSIDAIGTGNLIQKGVKQAVSSATGIAPDNILLASTHSHSAPDLQGLWGGVPKTWLDCDDTKTDQDGCGQADAWLEGVYQKAAKAALEAKESAVAANLSTGQTSLAKNRTRNEPGTATQTTDQALTVISATDMATGEQIATVMQYAAHPTILGSSNRLLHCDFVYGAVARLEKSLGGVGIYINGPIADAASSTGEQAACDGLEGNERDYCRAQDFGRQLGDQAAAVVKDSGQAMPLPVGLAVRHQQAILPVTNPLFIGAGLLRSFNRYYNFVETPADDIPEVAAFRELLPQLTPTAETTVSRVTFGSGDSRLELATIPGEGRNALGQLIRQLAWGEQKNARPTMLMGLTHNSFGYIIPEEEFGGPIAPELPYEETVSLGPLTAPLLRLQAYFPLFDAPQAAYAPEYFAACADPQDDACISQVLAHKLGYSFSGQ